MKSRISRWSEISCGFRLFFFFSVVLAFTSPASAGSGQLTVNPSNINFGSVSVGNSQTQSLTLTNSGWSRLTITKATSSGTGFTLTGPGYPVTLAGGQSVTCNVIFTPQSAGASSGSVAIVYSTHRWQYGGDSRNSTTVTLPVSGVGVTSGQLTTSPANLGFGSVLVGSSQTLAETLTNSGGASVTISAVGATASGFTANGLSLPLILNAGQSASFSVRFSPTSSRRRQRQPGNHIQRSQLCFECAVVWDRRYTRPAQREPCKPQFWKCQHWQQRNPCRHSDKFRGLGSDHLPNHAGWNGIQC